jgi:predicted alpha/beta-fold hydrolase
LRVISPTKRPRHFLKGITTETLSAWSEIADGVLSSLMSSDKSSIKILRRRLAEKLNSQDFVPHRVFRHGDTQTLAAYLWPLRPHDRTGDEERFFQVESDSQILARCRWQSNRAERPTLLMWHGMEGSTASAYMVSTADKAFRAGFNIVRVNVRNCGGTEHLTPTLYHGGLTHDVRVVIEELITKDRLPRLLVAGFSLGGNMILKLAGEYGENPPAEVLGICAISPSVDLRASTSHMALRRNWIYQQDFLRRLKNRLRKKKQLFPDHYDISGLSNIHSIEAFDDRFVAPAFGFADARDYYAKASSLRLISHIRIPTLIIHAQDDPFIPFAPLGDPSIATNPYVLLIAPERGGHVAFLSADSDDEDRFWAENRLIDFAKMVLAN